MLAQVDSLLMHDKREIALPILERVFRDQPANWEVLYRIGAAIAKDRPEEAALKFETLLAMRVSDDDAGVRAQARIRGRPNRTGAGPRSDIAEAIGQVTMRSYAAYQVRQTVGLENQNYYWWGSHQGNSWTPDDFGQARMGALAWLFHFAGTQGRKEEFLARLRPKPETAGPAARALWDWYYLQLVRQEELHGSVVQT
jgi:hypothetical protein